MDYTITASEHVRGLRVIVCPAALGRETRTARLANEFSKGRYSNREHGYLLPPIACAHFTKAHRLGVDVVKGALEWNDGDHFVRFGSRHPQTGFRLILAHCAG
jgi:hypothetical protein